MNKRKLAHLIGVTVLICSVLIPSVMDFSREQKTASATGNPTEVAIEAVEESETEIAKQPNFHFIETQINEEIHGVVKIQIESDMPVTEVAVQLPSEAKVQDALLLEGQTYQVNEEGQTILSQTMETKSLELPVVFDTAGEYQVSIVSNDESTVTATINITAGETSIVTEEPLESETEASSEILEVGIENASIPETETPLNNEKISRADENGVQDVATWVEFIRAFVDPTVTTINVIDDFATPSNPRLDLTTVTTGDTGNFTGGLSGVYLSVPNISRSLVIEGNNHQIDFKAVALCFLDTTANVNSPWDVELKDLEIYHGNYYGPVTFFNLSTNNQRLSTITYNNITNIGNQLIHSPMSHVQIKGVTSSIQQENYTSNFGAWRIYGTNQTNIFVSKMTMLKDSELVLATIGAGNIDLGYDSNGELLLEDGSKITATANGTSGEANGVNILIRSGSVMAGENSKISLVPQLNSSAISLLAIGASLNIGKNANVEIQSNGRSTNINNNNTNIIWLGAGSLVQIDEGGRLAIDAINQGSTISNVIHASGSAATLIVGKDSVLDIKSDSISQNQHLINFALASGTFQFSDAKKINLQRTGIGGTGSNRGLISMGGSLGVLDVDVQSVKQWSNGNLSEEADYNWTPIFNLHVGFTGTVMRLDSVSSISQETVDSFRANFTTQNVQRILFEKIPDVNVTINELSEDKTLEISHVITGIANPGSVIRFTGDAAIPTGTIPSPDMNSIETYHVQADVNGEYRYELPADSYFTVGNTVTAYAFLEGKSDTDSTVVQERLAPPNPLDPLNPDLEVDPENKPNLPEEQGQLSIDFISQFNFGTQSISTQDKTYYVNSQRLLNEDGTVNNTEERPNFVQVSDRRPSNQRGGWELSLSQESQFSTSDGKELVGAQLQLANAELISPQENSNPSFVETLQNLIPGVRQPLIIAEGDEGQGTWVYRFGDSTTGSESVKLQVPKGSNPNAESYSTTLNWELSAIPGN
ncbi:conserved exported hypothetical protein [Carnobacterium maltaromaticum]|uniref:WxL domain-containing protein n=1 Tax=Carnobacterium maltaromaticum TaxID=2751 RepID=UPI00191BAA18|nr:WxL domain-containing protein [Carnobacterium maltaromaticum]CAD5901549.1 conserved exported hypothetical protein [Carnobacterium maltaromaticum]